MNIIDALKSGRPFKRSSHIKYRTRENLESLGKEGHLAFRYYDVIDTHVVVGIDVDDILAEDWELKEVSVTLTKKQFWEVYREVLIEWNHRTFNSPLCDGTILNEIFKKLGL